MNRMFGVDLVFFFLCGIAFFSFSFCRLRGTLNSEILVFLLWLEFKVLKVDVVFLPPRIFFCEKQNIPDDEVFSTDVFCKDIIRFKKLLHRFFLEAGKPPCIRFHQI